MRHLTWNRSFTPAFPFPLPVVPPPNSPPEDRKSGMLAAVEIPAPQMTTTRRADRRPRTTSPTSRSWLGFRDGVQGDAGDEGPDGAESIGRTIISAGSHKTVRVSIQMDTTYRSDGIHYIHREKREKGEWDKGGKRHRLGWKRLRQISHRYSTSVDHSGSNPIIYPLSPAPVYLTYQAPKSTARRSLQLLGSPSARLISEKAGGNAMPPLRSKKSKTSRVSPPTPQAYRD